MAEELKLYRTWSSPFGLRIVHALKIKGLEYETILEDLSNKSPSLLEFNPVHKKIPVLVHNGKPICESLVILEYIDEAWKDDKFPLLPQDPYGRATVRFWAKFGDDKVLPSVWSAFLSEEGEKQQEAIVIAKANLKLVEEHLNDKKFFGGETVNYLDVVFGWMGNLLGIVEEVMDAEIVNAETFPRLSAWIKNFAEHEHIRESWPHRGNMVEKFKATREQYLSKGN